MLDADGFGDSNLDVVDKIAVPDRLKNGVGETEHQNILDGFLAEIMVDAVNLGLIETAMNFFIQFQLRWQGLNRMVFRQRA